MTSAAIDLPKKELFRVDEVARILGLKSSRTIYGWIKRGRISHIILPGGHKRIARHEIERIVVELHKRLP